MKIKNKKRLSLLLVGILIISLLSVCIFAFADDNVEINAENFPDFNFRNVISFMYDTDGDGYLSKPERSIESMILSGVVEMYAFENDLDEDSIKINNLKGIEFFDNLKSLRCSSVGRMDILDVSELDKLESLACNDLGLKSINLSSSNALINLSICSNDIESLDLSGNTNLKKLHCYSNDFLKSLNVNGLTQLEELRCDVCSIESLDLSANTNLNYLNCSYNRLTKLDLSNNTGLVTGGNDLTEYNIGHQSTSAYVKVSDGLIVVPLELENERVVSTNLDYNETVAYADGEFYTDNSDNLSNGISYSYNTGISDSAYLTVHVDVIEKEHYYSLSSFDINKNSAKIECPICKDSYSVKFADSINKREGNKKFVKYLDVVDDGIINAKDYAALVNEYK